MLGFASRLNLYAEEIDARSGRHLGNFPQAFTHLALINAVMHVIRADHDLAASQPLLRVAPRGGRRAVSDEPVVTRCDDPEAVAARVAEVMAAAIDGARTIHGAAHVALSGGSTPSRAYELLGPQLPDWRDVHLWYGDERCVPLDDQESNHRLATEHLDAPDATWHPVRDAARLRRGRRRLRARRSPTSRSTSRSTAWAPTGTPPRSSPASRRSTPTGVCVAVHGSPKPPPDRVTPDPAQAQRLAPDPARRHGRGQGADARPRASRARTPRCPPRCWTASAWRSSPTPRRSMADEVWLLRHAETEWSRTGTAHRAHRHPAHRRRAARWPAALRARLAGHAFALVLCSPARRARGRPRSSRALERSGLRDDLLEWDYGDYEGLTTPEIREKRPDWYLWRDGVPGGESPDDVAARCDRVIAEVRRPSRATSRSSPTATSCARWPRAGSTRRSPSADACTSARARSPCSPTSARSPSSAAGTASARSARAAAATRRARRGRSGCDRGAATSG